MKKEQYAVSYLHYVYGLFDTEEGANAYAKELETDREILNDMSQRDYIAPASNYINVSNVTGQDV
jgi:hypothetical protein